MIAFPNCKINLGLQITGKRADGFHDLETVFYPIPLTDILEIIPNPDKQASEIAFTQSGINIAGDKENNLCVKAYRLLKKRYPDLPSVKLHLHKNIPTGAGLGGGSADAAFVLTLLNKIGGLNLSNTRLAEMALELGSDCPFFLLNKPALAQGRGEILKEISIASKNWQLLLVMPGISVSTADAFKGVRPGSAAGSIEEIIRLPIHLWKGKLQNQFEETVFPKYPELKKIKESIDETGAVYTSMSGSGSSLFGLFDPEAKKPVTLMKQYPGCKWYRL